MQQLHIRKMGPCWIGVGGHCFNTTTLHFQQLQRPRIRTFIT